MVSVLVSDSVSVPVVAPEIIDVYADVDVRPSAGRPNERLSGVSGAAAGAPWPSRGMAVLAKEVGIVRKGAVWERALPIVFVFVGERSLVGLKVGMKVVEGGASVTASGFAASGWMGRRCFDATAFVDVGCFTGEFVGGDGVSWCLIPLSIGSSTNF